MEGMGTSSIRYLLYGINLLFVITGVVLISQGIAIKLYYKNYTELIQEQYIYVPNALIFIGVAIFLIAGLGWCGALNESSFITLMFSTFLLMIFFLEIAVGISGYILKTTTHQALANLNVGDSFNNTKLRTAWINLQQDFNCCGVQSPEEWMLASPEDELNLPDSCCTSTETFGVHVTRRHPEVCNLTSPWLHSGGCYKPLERFMQENSFNVEALGFALALFQLVGLAVSCHLAGEFRKGYQHI